MAAAIPVGGASEAAQALVAVLAPLSKEEARAHFELFLRASVKTSNLDGAYLHLPPASPGPTAPPPENLLTLFEALMSVCKQPFDSDFLRKHLHSALRAALKASELGWPRGGVKSFFYSHDGLICEDYGNHLRGLALRDPANQSDLNDMESVLRGTALLVRMPLIGDQLTRAKAKICPVMRPRSWKRSAVPADGQQQQQQPPPRNDGEPSSPSAPPASSGGGAQDGAPAEGAPAGEAAAPALTASHTTSDWTTRTLPSGSKTFHRGRIPTERFALLTANPTGGDQTASHVEYLPKTDTFISAFKKHIQTPYSHVQMISGNGTGGVTGTAAFGIVRWSEMPAANMPENERTREVRRTAGSSSFPNEVYAIAIGEPYALPPPNVENTQTEEAVTTIHRSEESASPRIPPLPLRRLEVLDQSVRQAANVQRLLTEAVGVIQDQEKRDAMQLFCEAVRRGTTHPTYIKYEALLLLAGGIEASPLLSVTLLTAATPSPAAGATSSSTEVGREPAPFALGTDEDQQPPSHAAAAVPAATPSPAAGATSSSTEGGCSRRLDYDSQEMLPPVALNNNKRHTRPPLASKENTSDISDSRCSKRSRPGLT
jgi:hypothetical protein